MKALSIRQPWAWLICQGYKDVENRTWLTGYRGTLYIHASKKIDLAGHWWIDKAFPKIQMPAISELHTGGLVGLAKLIDCVTEYDSPWFFGPYGFVFKDAVLVPFRPYLGKLKIFDVLEGGMA